MQTPIKKSGCEDGPRPRLRKPDRHQMVLVPLCPDHLVPPGHPVRTVAAEGDRIFYYCRSCGQRWTYMPERGGTSDDWPKEIFDEAVASGVVSKDGKIL